MKKSIKIFFRSFILSTIMFSFIAALVIPIAYASARAIDPQGKASNLLVAVVDKQDNLISSLVLRIEPKENAVIFVTIPDNTLVDDGLVLQSLYKEEGMPSFKKRAEALIGSKINRYLILPLDKLKETIDSAGEFEYTLSYPFGYDGRDLAGTVLMNGDLACGMLTYGGYNLTSISVSDIACSFLQGFFSRTTSGDQLDSAIEEIGKNDFCKGKYTDLSLDELREYASVLKNYQTMTRKVIAIEGEYNITSARIYFIPEATNGEKNIFE